MKMHSIHVGAKNVGEAVVRRCERIERSQSEIWNVFVDLLRYERDVEEELWYKANQ